MAAIFLWLFTPVITVLILSMQGTQQGLGYFCQGHKMNFGNVSSQNRMDCCISQSGSY